MIRGYYLVSSTETIRAVSAGHSVFYNHVMARITIEVSEGIRNVLEEMSSRTGRSVGELIEESILSMRWEGDPLELVRRARQRSALSESEAEMIARKETSS